MLGAESLSARLARSGTSARSVAAGGVLERHSLAQQVSGCEAVVRVVQAFTQSCRRGKLAAHGEKPTARAQERAAFSVQ